MNRRLYLLFLPLLLLSCGRRQTLAPAEYTRFLNSGKSGTIVIKEINGVYYKLKMQTPEYMALNNQRDGIKKEEDFKADLAYYKDKLSFLFLIEDIENHHKVKSTVFDKEMYGGILAYANTDLKNDFMLVSETDTVYCSLVHLETANSVQPVFRMSLGFSGVDPAKEFTLVYNDNIFNNGPLKFYYSKAAIDNLPKLKL